MKKLDIHISDFFKPSFGGFGRSILSILLLTVGMATTARAQIKILGNVYGGGDQAAVQGNTHIEINKGLYGGEIFGGGNGALNGDGTVNKSADIGSKYDGSDGVHTAGTLVEGTGATEVIISGGKFIVEQETIGVEAGKLTNNHNVFGGGNLACNVFDSTKVTIKAGLLPVDFFKVDISDPANPTSMYRKWGEYVGRIEGMITAKVPSTPEKLVQGSVFGAGYGVHTDVAGTTNVKIAIGDEEAINTPENILTRYAYAKRGGDTTGEHLASKFVITAFGGGYDGTAENTNVQISGSPFLQNVFGGGLGSKAGAEQKNPGTAYASTVGTVNGGTNVNITGATIYGNVYGGGAGIFGEIAVNMPGRGEANMPYYKAAMVMKETNLEISGGTLVFGNVYGGGDIANTGWFEDGYRPSASHQAYENESKAKFDLTTYLQMKGGNVMGNVFAGGNGRKITELEKANFIGAIIGNTSVVLGKWNGASWEAGTHIWGSVYGGGQNGCVYSCAAMAANNGGAARTLATGLIDGCTNVEFKHTDIGQDIFGGGLGAVEMVDHDHNPATPEQEVITSADISGNTFVFFNRGNLITGSYWDPQDCVFKAQNCGERFRDTESDIAHNLYGGGNVACTIGTKDRGTNKLATGTGNTTVYMIGAPVVDDSFVGSTYYQDAMKIYGKPHFSAFGAGYGKYAKVLGNAYSDIALVAAGFHSVVGGGMNGPVEGECYTHIACKADNTRIHNVYGGGYYAPVGGTHLQITEGHILENVFGGGVMGNIAPTNAEMTKSVTSTIIGLKNDGSDLSSYIVKGTDGTTPVREYTFASHQNKIIIEGNVYGGNDVSGTVNGIAELSIYGGEMKHDVYGAGNGDHDGYYEPGYGVYDRGDWGTDNYYYVDHSADVSTDGLDIHGPQGNTYIGRPQTVGGVKLTLAGNSTSDRVKVLGQVFGGGNSCTIGAWNKTLLESTYASNPHLVRDDPDYFVGGGKLSVTLGSHIRIGRTHGELDAASSQDKANYLQNVFINGQNIPENVSGLYMGCSGRHLATQTTDVDDHNYHHYYDRVTARYWPGFIVYKNEDGHTNEPVGRAAGLATFRAYLNNILIKTDDVSLNIANDADDIWISNFVGGGFRGSMKAFSDKGQFHYTLPRGVTIGHDIIGGAFNTDVVYHIFKTTDGHNYPTVTDVDGKEHYQYLTEVGTMKSMDEVADINNADYHHLEKDPITGDVTGIVRFYYNGGMLSELAYEKDPSENDRINRILKKYSKANNLPVDRDVNKDFTGTGLTDNKAFNFYKRDALVYLELNNKIEVEYLDGHVHGGNVFGGCFSSGRVEGDIWTDYRCYQERQQANSEDFNLSDRSFNNAKDFETNFAMMLFGAGYGANTNIQGSAYVRVLHPEASAVTPGIAIGYPRLYNVFGGSYEGKVEGNTNIYFNPGKYGYVTGAIYGGGCNGYVGGKTYLELAGGYIDEAYGGARNANVGGGTHIWAYDGSARWWGEDVVHSNGNPMIEADAEKAPLFIGKLYGGTDISGQICTDEAGTYDSNKGYQPYYTAEYWPKELTTTGTYDPEHPGDNLTYIDTYLQVGGIHQSDNGFPIIGSVYAAGNGENTKSFFDAKYAKTNKNEDKYTDAKLPHQHSTLMEVSDGNIVYAFGGGNRATVTDQNYILVRSELGGKHTIEDLGDQMYDVMKKRVLSVGVDCYDEKLVGGNKVLDLKNASIQRLFGGNNIATMAIQPKWQLVSGRINNVYSGGNMGDMTYYNESGYPATEDKSLTGKSGAIADDGSNSNYTPRGLSITIEHPEIHIGSLYGGCRLSDVIPGGYAADGKTPLLKDAFAESEDYYGATVNITDGYIENVYGGNDISGTVHFGTNVNISGAVSGNVYGSGNGFYLYKWDKDATQITEHLLKDFDPNTDDDKRLCYTVPASAAHGGVDADNTQKLLTINDARPSVEKAFLNIAGLEHYPMGDASNPKRVAYVKGNVFCGGNASTILGDQSGSESFTKFKIGSYVTLNGVFMGSDGYAFTQDKEIKTFADLNGFTDMEEATVASSFPDYDGATATSLDHSHNPILLNVYMMAVDMKAQPKDFNLNLPLTEAHIGTYCGGGNRGSMLVDKMVDLPFHHDIIIYDKIVGACLDANIRYNQGDKTVVSRGGYSRAVDVANNDGHGNTKMRLNIASQFVPLVMDVPADKLPGTKNEHGQTFAQAIAHDFLYDNRTVGVKYDYEEFNDLFQATWPDQKTFEDEAPEEIQWKVADGIYAPSCNIYGGCYQSGEVEGDIELNLYSNMLRYVNENDLKKSIAKNIACFNVYGAGFGQDSHVWGNVRITMDRNLDTSTMGTIGSSTLSSEIAGLLGTSTNWTIQNQAYSTTPTALDCSYPSFNNVIGGGRNGKLIGNSTIKILNGLVYTDVAGGCYASDMYGSTQVIVGYPKYYQCNTSGTYNLDRADKWNTAKLDGYGLPVIKPSVSYLKGDLVPNNIYESIIEKTPDNERFFTEVKSSIDPTVVPSTANGARGWDDVFIKIGNGVYGGGYSLPSSTAASAGNITTNKLKDDAAAPKDDDLHAHNFDGRPYYDETTSSYKVYGEKETVGYGGNSSVMVADMDATDTDNSSYNANRDHIHISTLTATVANIPSTSTVIGKFIKENDGRYTHQGDHNPVNGVTYYTLTGDGGIYGDGHLTFCEGFRSADVTRYGWAEGTPKHPILMNTFQRMDLLSVNDCCLMLQGAQDFATDQIDATIYSITRINEMRLNSTLDANSTLGQISAVSGASEGPSFDTKQQRNYLAFFNNVHYLGSIVTNDPFGSKFHAKEGNTLTSNSTYLQEKQRFINEYMDSDSDGEGNKKPDATNLFKQRNVATARNAIGINNGYCLRVLNQEYDFTGDVKVSKNYYGPIVGVCEVKLLTLVQGEGGGYVYADNVHEDETGHDGKTGNDYFLMTSGNFVFPGIIQQGEDPITHLPIGDQYIVDDCFVEHFGENGNITKKHRAHGEDLDEAHYWYVEGNKYFFQTTLTGFTYKKDLVFDLIKTDPNIVLSGLEKGSSLNIKKIEWLSAETGFHRKDYEAVLPNSEKAPEKTNDYEFDIEIGGYDTDDWKHDMPRYSVGADDDPSHHYTQGMTLQNNHLPQFNIKLQDKLDNSGDLAYVNHLDEPELVKIYLQGNNNGQIYEYTITVNIVYLQGPTVTGGVKINNCALPGENIAFSTDGLVIKTPELMPVTSASWQILPLKQINEDGSMEWDMTNGIVIDPSRYREDPETQNIIGDIRALYKQNEYNIAYIFTAGGYDFPVMPVQTIPYTGVADYNATNNTTLDQDAYNALTEAEKVKSIPDKNERMIVVHNYHRMKDVTPRDLQIEAMPIVPDYTTDPASHHSLAEAKIYIEDEEDLRAFVEYLNMATEGNAKNIPVGLTGLDIILQKDINLTNALPTISQPFEGTFHGDGYHIDLKGKQNSLFGDKLAGKVYNLGLIGSTAKDATHATIASSAATGTVTNSYVYEDVDENFVRYGRKAYELSHTFNPTTDHSTHADYVANYYANGDYQYATTNRVWSLRTGAPNYGNVATSHNQEHTHDAARWDKVNQVFVPLYDGTAIVPDKQVEVGVNIVTYHGLPEGYANDYLFFGQHLDKTNADTYPVHIEPVAKGDTGYDKGGNRVYRTSGFYGSAVDQDFFYNRDAWALYPGLTAIDFTFRNNDEKAHNYNEQVFGRYDEGDDTSTVSPTDDINQPKWFNVDSNVDYNGGTYDNASYGYVSQNLIVVGENATENPDQAVVLADGTYENGTEEKDIRYHRVQLKNGATGVYEIDYFHLVDKQDYNSPVSYTVNRRAWYERYPQVYRNVTPNPTEPTYQTPSAWEGITLPFQYIEKVSGEPQTISGETYENVLSHFYGETTSEMEANPAINDRTLHHEYWLTGLVGAAEGKATFARPTGTNGTGNFYIGGLYAVWPFTYVNNYYRHLSNYGDYSDTRDDDNAGADVIGQHDNDWYFTSHEFADYPRQNQGTPYLCAFPGEDFYEFSLEGQKITFEKVGSSIIAVSDVDINTYGTTTVNGHSHIGTYMHVTADGSHLGVNAEGTAFVAEQAILPFRTYMTAAPSTRAIYIMDDGIEEVAPRDEFMDSSSLSIEVDGLNVTVENGYERDKVINVHLVSGQLVLSHVATNGESNFRLPKPGLYIINGKKVMAKESRF